jgi:hypothetical protein
MDFDSLRLFSHRGHREHGGINNKNKKAYQNAKVKSDVFVKNRHSGEPRIRSGAGSEVKVFCKLLKLLDSGFRRNDEKTQFQKLSIKSPF